MTVKSKCGQYLYLVGTTMGGYNLPATRAGGMDIYWFFHPHHNPRLHSTALRMQEIGELEQVAIELRKALERAKLRTSRAPGGIILPGHFEGILKAIRFVERSLRTLGDAHPGDSEETRSELLRERSRFAGWKAWSTLFGEHLALEGHPLNGNGVIKDPTFRSARSHLRPSDDVFLSEGAG